MRSFLLSLVLILIGKAVFAQAPQLLAGPFDGMACSGGSGGYILAEYFAYDPFTIKWEESADNGDTWRDLTGDANYNSGYYLGSGRIFLSVTIKHATLAMNHYQYRITLTNSYGTSGPSPVGILYVAQAPPDKPIFVNPVTEVCQGETVLYTIKGLKEDSIYWSLDGGVINGAIADTMRGFNFSQTGTSTLSATALNGCGFMDASSVTVTVNPLQTTLPATAGGGPVCSDFYTGTYGNGGQMPTTFADASCNPVLLILPSGTKPVYGNIQSCVTVDASVQTFNGVPYVPRHYSLVPALTDPSASTATVTLYFTQGDFDAYNLARGSNPALPINSTDAAGNKANLRITQFHGTGTTPDTYAGGNGEIDPDDSKIVWNATASRWEVTFDITGFSGFFVSSGSLVPLPVTLADFSGKVVEQGNELRWATSLEENTAYFEVQKAGPDGVFKDLAKVAAAGNSHQLLQYSYVDASGGSGSYRLEMVDIDGHFTYSKIVVLGAASGLFVRVSPNPAHQPQSLIVGSPVVAGAVLTVTDISGKKVVERRIALQKGDNSLDPGILTRLPQGIYIIGVATDKQRQMIKFVKE